MLYEIKIVFFIVIFICPAVARPLEKEMERRVQQEDLKRMFSLLSRYLITLRFKHSIGFGLVSLFLNGSVLSGCCRRQTCRMH